MMFNARSAMPFCLTAHFPTPLTSTARQDLETAAYFPGGQLSNSASTFHSCHQLKPPIYPGPPRLGLLFEVNPVIRAFSFGLVHLH